MARKMDKSELRHASAFKTGESSTKYGSVLFDGLAEHLWDCYARETLQSRNLLPYYPINFEGDNSREAEDFIRAVNIQAFKTGKSNDQEWLTAFASASFAGTALRWYRRLPSATRKDWDLLQEAILDKEWDSEVERSLSGLTLAATMPTPAAALPGASSLSPSNATAISAASILPPPPAMPSPWKTGTIRVAVGGNANTGYLTLHADGSRLCYSSSPDEAINLRHERPLESGGGGQSWSNDDIFSRFGAGATGHLCTIPVTDPSKGSVKTRLRSTDDGSKASGPTYVALWNVLQNGSLVATVKQMECTYKLEFLVSTALGWTWLTSDPKAGKKRWPDSKAETARPFSINDADLTPWFLAPLGGDALKNQYYLTFAIATNSIKVKFGRLVK
ncbi:hypothetical protein FRC04_011268 [Tulasnella sp. 424]|nr:hypothetical protein FRC04_011268 [Tulasnella sp. 424]